ncbi:MAG TPA: hypothetical protein PKY51_11795 [Fimbriimonadaceae bacterium]|nr:hypothetical protein [Fimbriimonadaceae bacterium]
MLGQTFVWGDLAVVGLLTVMEVLLSADNALVLAIMVKHLRADLQKKALLYGLGGAFIFRFVAILLAKQVMQLWWLQAIGALYLAFLPFKHFFHLSRDSEVKPKGLGFWQTVLAVELTDIAFAIDSVLAGVALIRGQADKIWVVYVGALIGVIALRFAAGAIVKLLFRFPALDHMAYVLIGWVAVKLTFLSGHNYVRTAEAGGRDLGWTIPEMPPVIFWSVLGLILVGGIFYASRHPVASLEETSTAPTQDTHEKA